MAWRDDLRRVTLPDGRRLIGASFRGVPFFVEEAGRSGGRRAQVHEFPFRDDPFVDDTLGRKARQFPLEGYVLGDDYIAQRDALLSALEDVEGPGELVHPYHGIRRVVCTGFQTRESRRDGGIVVISMELVEAPAQAVTPSAAPDLVAQVDASADAALAATEAEFVEEYDVAGLPAFALESASAALASAAEGLGAALAPVAQATQELASLTVQIRILTDQAASLVREPAEVLGAFRDAIGALAEAAAAAPRSVWRALLDSYGFAFASVTVGTTETRTQEAANLDALVAALRRVLVIEAARLMPLITFEHHDDARDARDEVTGLLAEQEGSAGDVAYPALVQLRADVARAVPGDTVLARLVTIERRVAVPSLLLAYQLYGSVEREPDIVARNRAAHPGFLAGTLKVLSRV